MTPTIDFSQFTPEQLQALSKMASAELQMSAQRPEPVDANVITNPNLGKRIPYPKMIYNHQTRQTLIVKDEQAHQAAEAQGYVTEPFFDDGPQEPKIKGPGFAEEESNEVAELRALVEGLQEQVQQSMARKPMNRRSGE